MWLKKKLSAFVARQAIENLLNLFEIVGVDGEDLKGALSVPLDDYEDALQAHCTKKVSAECMVSRDSEGFINTGKVNATAVVAVSVFLYYPLTA
jgi:hypothetical protein